MTLRALTTFGIVSIGAILFLAGCSAGANDSMNARADGGAAGADGGAGTGCAGKACGADDGAGGRCPGTCPDAGEFCNPATFTCEPGTESCSGRKCGDVLGSGTICFGECEDAADVCAGGPEWRCERGGTDPCDNAPACGATDPTGKSCPGPCADVSTECKFNADPGTFECAACNQDGAAVDGFCTAQTDCACGSDCVKLSQDDDECAVDPEKCQKTGQCLEDCFVTGRCAAESRICIGTKIDDSGYATAGECFAQGRLSGNFAARTLDSCDDLPATDDFGHGNLSYEAEGRTYSWDTFVACRSTAGESDMIVVAGFRACGTIWCPDQITIALDSALLNAGSFDLGSNPGRMFVEHDEFSTDGTTMTGFWVRGLGIDGKVNYTAAGKQGKQPIAGTTDVTMIRYDWQACNETTGDPVKCSEM